MEFLGGLTPERFLKEYWEKKPLLIRGAFPGAHKLSTFEEFKELAFDEEFETRIIYNSENKYSVEEGPFGEEAFTSEKYTFACHNLNTLSADFFELEKCVDFIPKWLFDDVMGTLSNTGATIGAHIDKYNVFILQGTGRRLWKLQENPDHTYDPDKQLKILKNFKPNIEWTLEPGDMIYIPSSVAHEGTSLEDSLSYSIGFKSIEDQIVLDNFLTDCLENIETEKYLKIDHLEVPKDKNSIPKCLIPLVHKRLQSYIGDENFFRNWFISFLSKGKDEVVEGEIFIQEEIIANSKRDLIFKDQLTRIATFDEDSDKILSINKVLYRIEKESYGEVERWFSASVDTPIEINFHNLDNDQWPLLIDLFKRGIFYFEPS